MKEKPATKVCKHCKSEIAYDAKICPHCRKKQKKGMGCLIAIIVVIVIAGIIGSASEDGNDSNETNNTVATTDKKDNKKKEEKVEIMKIDPEELITDYEANEVKGDEIYDGKMMELTGKIGDIGKDLTEEVYITFARKSDLEFTSVQCYFKDKDEIKKVMELSKGDTITVQGKCDGKFGNVLIKNCVIK